MLSHARLQGGLWQLSSGGDQLSSSQQSNKHRRSWWPEGVAHRRMRADFWACIGHINIKFSPCFPRQSFAPSGPHLESHSFHLFLIHSSHSLFSQIAVTTRTPCPPTALETPGLKRTPKATYSSVCALAMAGGSGSVSDMLHFTPLAWVRNDKVSLFFLFALPPAVCVERRMYARDRCHEEPEIRSAKCPCVEVWETCLVTREHDLVRKRSGRHGNKEGEMCLKWLLGVRQKCVQ